MGTYGGHDAEVEGGGLEGQNLDEGDARGGFGSKNGDPAINKNNTKRGPIQFLSKTTCK